MSPNRFSSPFLKPVSERQAPGYKDVVKRSVEKGSRKVGCFYICLFILYFPSVRLFISFILSANSKIYFTAEQVYKIMVNSVFIENE